MQAPVVKERNLGHPGRGSRILNDGGHPEKLEAVFGQRSQGCTHQWPGVPCSLFTRRKISISLCNSPQNCDGTKFAFSLFLKLCILLQRTQKHTTHPWHIFVSDAYSTLRWSSMLQSRFFFFPMVFIRLFIFGWDGSLLLYTDSPLAAVSRANL